MSVQADVSVQKDVRTQRLELRLSVQERERIEAKAKSLGMSLSDFIRFAALAVEGAQGVASESRSDHTATRIRKASPAKDSVPCADAPSPPEPIYHCPNDCTQWRPRIADRRCPTCNRRLVPV